MHPNAKWIWLAEGQSPDQYGEFYNHFDYAGGKALLRISADSNYAVYLNGVLTYSGQYPDFPHYKVYDELDLTAWCKTGLNHLAVVVWYYGVSNFSYCPGNAALRYELELNGTAACLTNEQTLSRLSRAYRNYAQKCITSQLGYTFHYDLTKEDGWMTGALNGFAPSAVVAQELPMYPRPLARPVTGSAQPATLLASDDDRHFLIDLGAESVGLLSIIVESSAEQEVLITYGEHLTLGNGHVLQCIGGRDFSMTLRLKQGENVYANPFRRLGLRYLELHADAPLKLTQLTVLPVDYPVTLNTDLPAMNETQQRIYDVAVNTLQKCMHDHYEDCPWREQGLYAMDSRNQMLCGYYAFKEYAFPRACLLLFSKDSRPDDLLSIVTPCADPLAIPSFSLHYFNALREYTEHSGDLTLIREVWPRLLRLLNAFTSRLEDDLVPDFQNKYDWNFYEWSEGMSSSIGACTGKQFDVTLNALLSLALQSMQKMADLLGIESDYAAQAERINRAAYACFYDKTRGIVVNSTVDANGSELGNALALLSGIVTGEEAAQLARKLAAGNHGLTPATLSMLCFLYDALLTVDRDGYRTWVLDDIAARYTRMLERGATTFWETEKGEVDFGNAGSLCHGWSAMPVYYFHTLL